MNTSYIGSRHYPKPKYTNLSNCSSFKCGGSKCSCQFRDGRTLFDQSKINDASFCKLKNMNVNNSFDKESWHYQGV